MLNIEEMIEDLVGEESGCQYFVNPSFDTAIIGISHDNSIIYSYDKMIQWMVVHEDCSVEEAIEWIEYNTIRTIPYMHNQIGQPPIICYDIPEEVLSFYIKK